MQASLNTFFKTNKKKHEVNAKGKNVFDNLSDNIKNPHHNDILILDRSKKLADLNDSIDFPETKQSCKRAKLDESIENNLEKAIIPSERIISLASKDNQGQEELVEISSKTKMLLESLKFKKNDIVDNFIPKEHHIHKEDEKIFTHSVVSDVQLSVKTLEIINKIKKDKSERVNRFMRESLLEKNRNESSFSLKFKYEDLLKEERELIIPPLYKILLNLQNYLDNSINSITLKKEKIPYIEEIIKMIQIKFKQKFDLKIFQQILFIVPHFYVYSWIKSGNDYCLRIDIPSDYKERINNNYDEKFDFHSIQSSTNYIDKPIPIKDINERTNIMKKILLEYTNENHKEFLNSMKYSKEFDAFRLKTWHHDFDLVKHNPSIPIFEIIEKPSIKITTINDFLIDISTNSLVKEAIKSCKNEDKCNAIEQESPSKIKNIQLNRIISQDLLQKIKFKESQSLNNHNKIISDLKEICDKIKTLMLLRDSPIRLNDLCSNILKGYGNLREIYNADKIKELIYKIREIIPNWLRIKEHSSEGFLVTIDSTPMTEIYKHIDKYELD